MKAVTRADFAHEMGFSIAGGDIDTYGIATLLRLPPARWGLAPRRDVVRYVREQVEAAGLEECDSERISKVLDRLIAVGELAEAKVGDERCIAPTAPRWLRVGGEVGVLIGGQEPSEVELLEPSSREDLVRRVRVSNGDDEAALQVAGFRRCELDEWLNPLGYLSSVSRRMREPFRHDQFPIARFWEVLIDALGTEGQIMGPDADIRVVSGRPGSKFGHIEDASGRWRDDTEEGSWCAARRGYGEKQWHPCVITADGDEMRCLDLFDWDEWGWALLSRGCAVRDPERLRRDGHTLNLTFTAPRQLCAALDLLGPRISPWKWEVPDDAVQVWADFGVLGNLLDTD
jgi:hypothetical protein